MNRTILTLSMCWGLLVVANAKTLSDEDLGRYSARAATNLLSQNIEDKDGLILLKVALALCPDDDNVLLIQAMLTRQKSPLPIKTKATKKKLIPIFIKRGNYWMSKDLKKNIKARFKAVLYFQATDALTVNQPVNDVLIALEKLEKQGYVATLSDLSDAGPNAVKLDDEFVAPKELAAEPIFKGNRKFPFTKRKQAHGSRKGPRGSVLFQSGKMKLRLSELSFKHKQETGKSYGYLVVSWELAKKGPYISSLVSLPVTVKDNLNHSLAKADGLGEQIRKTPTDNGFFTIAFDGADSEADRLSLVKGNFCLQMPKETVTEKISLPLKRAFKKGQVTVIPVSEFSNVSTFRFECALGGDVHYAALVNGASLMVRFDNGKTEKPASQFVNHLPGSFAVTYNIFKQGRVPQELIITYPTKLESVSYPFEFRNIGLPDAMGDYYFK